MNRNFTCIQFLNVRRCAIDRNSLDDMLDSKAGIRLIMGFSDGDKQV